MKIIILLVVLFMIGCVDTARLNVRPSKTTVTYGHTATTNDTIKDAKNDVFTDTEKESWTVKQEFVWGREK